MGRRDYEVGSSELANFYKWIDDRHWIWILRAQGELRPWTEDPIFLDYKFTNAFRQLDKGTVALRSMLAPHIERLEELYRRKELETREEEALILWNVIWYRLWNLQVHAEDLGFCRFEDLVPYMKAKAAREEKIFTSAHMTTGVAGEAKVVTYLRAAEEAWDDRFEILEDCIWQPDKSMKMVFKRLLDLYMVGKFVSYEMVCDLRFTPLLRDAPDINTWANVGPGAKRGMERLGLEPTLETMLWLLYKDQSWKHLPEHVLQSNAEWAEEHGETMHWPPFELREIEHSLCEFDKYERVRLEQGHPRQKYNGRSE